MEPQEPNEVTEPLRIGGPRGSETEFYLAERWATDSHGVTRCGDLLIGLDPDDRTRVVLEAWPGKTAGFSNGSRPAFAIRDSFPVQYEDSGRALYAIIAHRFAEFENQLPPREGLDEWAELASGYAWAAIEEARREATEELATLPGQTAAEILATTPVEPKWIIPGVLAPGWAIMLSGREKLGKGSFVFYLLGRLEQGGQETVFGSLPEDPVTSVIYSDEPVESVREKVEAFGLKHARIVHGWQLADLPTWPEKAAKLVQIAARLGAGIVFVDNISRAAGIEEESGNELSRLGLEPLISRARPLGLSVIIDHHHKKGRDSAENMSRGGTSLPGAVEVKLDMFRVGKRMDDRRRKLTAIGRIHRTVWERAFELTEDGRDYVEIEPEPDREQRDVAEQEAERITDLWKLTELGGQTTVKAFAEALGGVSRQTAMRRLDMLFGNGLVDVERNPGKASVYRVKPPEDEEVSSEPH
jgi:DNA-binding transcriptional ArsR family regulator